MVDRGEGGRLGDFQSADAEVQAFINSVPALAAKIGNIFTAIQEGSLGKINNVVEVTFISAAFEDVAFIVIARQIYIKKIAMIFYTKN